MQLSDESKALVKTPAFKRLLRELEPYVNKLESSVLDAAAKEKTLEAIREKAGRLEGARYLLGVLKHTEKVADGRSSKCSGPS